MKELKQQTIPVHRIETQFPLGIEFNYMEMTNEHIEIMVKSNKNIIHRDDYYMFLFLEGGSAIFILDFEEIQLQENSVFYIRPGQVHFASSVQETKGWFLAIDSMLVGSHCKSLFEGQFSTQRSIPLDTANMARMSKASQLLQSSIKAHPTAFSNDIILNLANTFIGLIAEQYARLQGNSQYNKSRSALIVHEFKELLSENFRTVKSPFQYAQRLNYSLSHLNESVKNITGSPVSYWIHQQVILEAKRMLYYTDMDVKEIAFNLGYEDHTYFSRLFSKVAGVSPKSFRHKFRE